jgi:hypothetical protein
MSISTAMSLALRRRGGATDGSFFSGEGNELNELLTSQGLPPYTEITRKGKLWSVQTATPFAAIVGLPSTTAKLEIKNAHPTDSFIVESIWSWQLLGTAVVWAHTPWAQVGAAVVSAVAALTVGSGNGDAAYTSTAAGPLVTAVDQTVVATNWRVFPGSTMNFGLAAATPGGANVGQVDGRLIVPPGKSLHVAVSGSVNTASAFHCGAAGVFATLTNQ